MSATLQGSRFKVVHEQGPADPIKPGVQGLSGLYIIIESGRPAGGIESVISAIVTMAPAACVAILATDFEAMHDPIAPCHFIGILPRSISPASLLLALELLLCREVVIGHVKAEGRIVATSPMRQLLPSTLSARELQILELLAQGQSNKHIARVLSIEEPTVKAHVRSVLRKTGASNRTQAAMKAHLISAASADTTTSESAPRH